MLNFEQIRNLLYDSDEIMQIPDNWEESVPFYCHINEESCDAFLYWIEGECVEIKKMIIISTDTGIIREIDADTIKADYHLTTDEYRKKIITDYDRFFSAKDRYEELYDKLHSDLHGCKGTANNELLREAIYLFEEIVGQDLFNGFFSVIAKDYLDMLQD